jgi:thiamine-monophosphate kinase
LDTPVPRVGLGIALRGIARSVIDISDGLVADLGHICERSRVAAVVGLEDLPRSVLLKRQLDRPAARAALLSGGDDYELCFTAVAGRRSEIEALSGQARLALTRIGSIVAGQGIVVMDEAGKPMSVKEGGFDHFR